MYSSEIVIVYFLLQIYVSLLNKKYSTGTEYRYLRMYYHVFTYIVSHYTSVRDIRFLIHFKVFICTTAKCCKISSHSMVVSVTAQQGLFCQKQILSNTSVCVREHI